MFKQTILFFSFFVTFLVLSQFQESSSQTIIKSMKYPDNIYWYSYDWTMYYSYSYKTLYKHDFSTNEIAKQYDFPQRITARNSSTNGRFMVIGCDYWWIQVWDTWMDELLIQAQVIPNQFGDPWTDAIIDLIISSDGKYVQAKGYSYREYRCYSLEKKRNITIYNELPGYATPGNTPAPDSTFKNPILFLPQGFGIFDLKPLEDRKSVV